jgi:hypothetical protein
VINGIKTLSPAADDVIMFGIGISEIALLKCRDQDSYMHELMIALVKTKQKNLTRRKTANYKIVVQSKWKMEACSS